MTSTQEYSSVHVRKRKKVFDYELSKIIQFYLFLLLEVSPSLQYK